MAAGVIIAADGDGMGSSAGASPVITQRRTAFVAESYVQAVRVALLAPATWSPPLPCDSTRMPASLTQTRPEPLLVSGDCAGI